jgi:outer membrane protein OmpA-like peptidoglycan-associated protein
MNAPVHAGLAGLCLLLPIALTTWQVSSAASELKKNEAAAAAEDAPRPDIAAASNKEYCSDELRKILRRVLQSCGLLGSGEVRGCQPLEAKQVATLGGSDFNALFLPLADRAGILQFEQNSAELDPNARHLLDQIFSNQGGGSYFFVVARSSPEGSAQHNRELSQQRGEAVLKHLQETYKDPDLEKEVGLLWLGEEFAQLDQEFCRWQRSGSADACQPQDLNRSAFVAWIDCRL